MTSAAVRLGEERPVIAGQVSVERVALDGTEVAGGSGLASKLALSTIAVVEIGWLTSLGYLAIAILR